MNKTTFGLEYSKELEAEETSTRKCLERIPESLFGWKPHEKSMKMGDLVVVVAAIPKWITDMLEKGDIDFATYEHFNPKNTKELVDYFNQNIKRAKDILQNVADEVMDEPFALKDHGQVLMTSTKKETIISDIHHMVHHRGQLTVYMRLNNILVPSIYGPSADDKTF